MPIRPSGLGRGLNSLIPSKKHDADYVTDEKLHEVIQIHGSFADLPIDSIVPNPHQPRQSFDQESLESLAESIKEHGVIQPIVVSKKDGRYELIAGERRLRASKLVGVKTIPAIIRELSEQKKMEFALIENLQREGLNPLEVAIAYRKLEDEFNLSHEEVGKKVGKSAAVIINYLRLLNLRDEVKEAIIAGLLTEGHARTLCGLPYEDQLEVMNEILSGKFTVRQAEKAAREVVVRKKIRPLKDNAEIKEIQSRLSTMLGTKVSVTLHGGVGQIVIKYFSEEELHSIVDKILY